MRRTKHPPRTQGSKSLEAFLIAHDHSHGWLARKLELAQPSVSAWISGTSRPEPEMREALRLLTGIDPRDWYTADELARIERVRLSVEAA